LIALKLCAIMSVMDTEIAMELQGCVGVIVAGMVSTVN